MSPIHPFFRPFTSLPRPPFSLTQASPSPHIDLRQLLALRQGGSGQHGRGAGLSVLAGGAKEEEPVMRK